MPLEKFQAVEEPYPFTDQFRQDWADLFERSVGANVFSRLAWLEAGWRNCAPGGNVIRPVRFLDDQGRTRAMCVHLEIEVRRPWGRLHIWKTLDFNTQRMAPFLAESIEDMASAMAALYRWQGRRIDAFDLFKLDPLDGGLEKLADLLIKAGLDCELSQFNDQPRVVMDENWDDFKKRRSYKTWKNLRRQRRRIDEELGPVSLVRLREPGDFEKTDLSALLDMIFEIFKDSWQAEATLEAGVLTLEQVRDFYAELAQTASKQGWLDLNILYAGQEAIAYDINFVEGNRVYMLAGAFRKELDRFSPGGVLFHDWMIDSHARGDRILEFGGEYLGYKEKWSAETIAAYHLRVHGRTMGVTLRRLRAALSSSWPARFLRAVLRRRWSEVPVHHVLFDYSAFHVVETQRFKPPKIKVPEIELKELTPDDLPIIAACRGLKDPSGSEMANRFQDNVYALGAWLGGELAGFCFTRLYAYAPLEEGDPFDMDLGPEGGYLYDAFVALKYRKAHIFQNLVAGVFKATADQGIKRVYLNIKTDNVASLGAAAKMGGQIVETIRYICLFGIYRIESTVGNKVKKQWGRCKSSKKFVCQTCG